MQNGNGMIFKHSSNVALAYKIMYCIAAILTKESCCKSRQNFSLQGLHLTMLRRRAMVLKILGVYYVRDAIGARTR
jgi:hypothetical protein